MSQSFDLNAAYDALDDTVYDIFDVDAYCSSLSPSVPDSESAPNTPTPASRPKRHPKTRGHPHPSPAVVSPPSVSLVSTSAIASTSSFPTTVPAKPNKGKGRQCTTTPTSSASPVDPPSSVATASIELTPEQHLCFVQMLKRLDEWLAQGWQPGVDESRLRTLAEIFNAAESIAEGSLCNIRRANLTWRLADSQGWEKSARSSIMGAIDIQVTVTKILFKDYGEPLIVSFWSFLGQKETELGDSGRPSGISGPLVQKETGRRDLKPNLPKRVQFSGLDGTPRGALNVLPEWDESSRLPADKTVTCVPTYDEACRSLAHHLAFASGTTFREWVNLLFSLCETTTGANALHSQHAACPLPDGPFTPVIIDNQLRYLLTGRGCVTDSHPLGRFRCFQCNSLGHWSPDHDRGHGAIYGGPPHSGVLPGNAR